MQVGVSLLLFASFEGFIIPQVAAPRVGLSVHTLAAIEGILLLILGVVWSRLTIGVALSRTGIGLLVYSNLSILCAYSMAAIWGAGNETIPIAAGAAHGSALQEASIKCLAYSSAPTGIVSFAIVLWGLRGNGGQQTEGNERWNRA
jgi:hydroxylaminobenzene mutase